MECPKCGYKRQPQDSHVMEGICPNCGIAYLKWKARQADENQAQEGSGLNEEAPDHFVSEPLLPVWRRLLTRLMAEPEKVDSVSFSGQALIYVAFFFWGWSFILGGIDWQGIGGSFLHSVNLPFHEFGHVLFSPFGRFMMFLGGSLFQVLMPLGLMLAFIIQRRDNFAASIMLWWSGQNFIDVSPYIADARQRSLPLIMGMGEESHDWGNLLRMSGTLDKAQSYAQQWFTIGVILMLLSFCWGGWLLYRQFRRLQE
ncbi:hypothetical protein ACQUQP_11980 [Marinobacterium sp. YM272]|uniref:hypothetical protein n=1 Tax=Marinobacterium sp. YM272 TaxID=3421654 RepID=UPI003D7FA115